MRHVLSKQFEGIWTQDKLGNKCLSEFKNFHEMATCLISYKITSRSIPTNQMDIWACIKYLIAINKLEGFQLSLLLFSQTRKHIHYSFAFSKWHDIIFFYVKKTCNCNFKHYFHFKRHAISLLKWNQKLNHMTIITVNTSKKCSSDHSSSVTTCSRTNQWGKIGGLKHLWMECNAIMHCSFSFQN